MNQENKPELTLKIQKIKQIIKGLENPEHEETKVILQLLRIMIDLFEDVEQWLTEIEKKPELQNSNPHETRKSSLGFYIIKDYE